MGRLQTVTVTELNGQAVNDVTTYTYDLDGNLHTTTTNTGSATLTATNTYDDLDRLLSLVNTDASGTVISSYTYQRNAMGDVTKVDETAQGQSDRQVNYQYDALERLTSETDIVGTTSTTTGYTYDLVGNRLTQTDASGTTTSTYNADDQLKTETAPDQTVTKYDYDLNGSLKDTTSTPPGGTPTTTASYTFDARNRLVSATVNGQQEALAYDDDGNRISSTTTASGTTAYENDEQSPTGYTQVLAEKDGATGATQAAYAWGLQLIAQARPATGASVYLFDGHGNVRALASTSGAVTDTYVYAAFGNLTASTGSTTNVYRYTAQRFDAILGEYDLRARDYAPSTGRFSTMDDPRLIGGPGDLDNANLYVYCGGNPVNMFDPDGHDGLVSTLVSAGIQSVLQGLKLAVPFRALGFAKDLVNGVSLMEATENAAIGLLEDSAFNFGFGAALRFLTYAEPVLQLRQAGQAFTRLASSVWNLKPFARGFAIEARLLEGLPNLIPASVKNFPVIDYFFNGIARSIKSLDLTAATYEDSGAIISRLSDYAEKLSNFTSKFWRGIQIPPPGTSVASRELVVALEAGAATSTQTQALEDFRKLAATKWPNVKVLFEWVP